MDDERVASPRAGHDWTRPGDYLTALARRRTARRSRAPNPENQHEATRFPVHMVPFVALMVVLAILVVATVLIAFPGNQPPPRAKSAEKAERGYAPKGWMQEAERDFHH